MKELEELARQLRQPEGPKGVEIADMMHATNIGMTRHAIEMLNIAPDDHVLELGHGNAAHLGDLLSLQPGLKYTGLDIAPLMKEEAERHNPAFVGNQQASFRLYDGRNLPFPDRSFDKIFTVNTIYFWEDPQYLLSELYRILKPGGRLAITFALESFMQTLPFTSFGFDLYGEQKFDRLIETGDFKVTGKFSQTEKVLTKSGEEAEREFVTAVVERL